MIYFREMTIDPHSVGIDSGLISRYNSIQSPAVYGYRRTQNGLEFTCLKQRESYEQISNFWGEKQPYSI